LARWIEHKIEEIENQNHYESQNQYAPYRREAIPGKPEFQELFIRSAYNPSHDSSNASANNESY
jgi:hypothetical protein